MKSNPFVSICIISYKQEDFIQEALRAAVSQDYDNYEVIVSDDCSPDRTYELISDFKASYTGTVPLIINQNKPNLGITGNLQKAISLSKGEYIVLAAGDDISLPNRVLLSVEKIKEAGVDSLSMNFSYIDGLGNSLNNTGFSVSNQIQKYSLADFFNGTSLKPSGPSRIITRRILDIFGPLSQDCPTEDTTFTFRSLLLNGVAHYGEIGVLYRIHGNNVSSEDNLFTRIDPQKIFDQYCRDLEVAKQKQLINVEEYESLQVLLADYLIIQKTKRKEYRAKGILRKQWVGIKYLLNPKIRPSLKKGKKLRSACGTLFYIPDMLHYVFFEKFRNRIN